MMESFDESSKMLQAESSNTVSKRLWKHNLINIKPKGVKTKDEFIEKHKLSNVINSSQDTGYYVDSRQCDTTEGSLAVSNIVNFVDKKNVMCPKRLEKSYSCTARSTFRLHEPRIKRHKIHYNCKDNNNTISKMRSNLLKTILNTKLTQSTPSQCTYNIKGSKNNKSHSKNNIFVESKQQPNQTKYLRQTEDTFEGALQRQSAIAPKLEKILHQIIDNSLKKQDSRIEPPQKYQRIKGRNEFGFSRLGSKCEDFNTGLISSDLSISGRDKILCTKNNYKIYQTKYNQYNTYVNSKNNLLIKSASASSATCSTEIQGNNTEKKYYGESQNYIWNKVQYYSSKDSCYIASGNDSHLDPRLADQLTSHYKTKNLSSKNSFTSKKHKSISDSIWSSSNESYIPNIINTEYQMKRHKISKKYQLGHMASNLKHNNFRHTKWNITNANKKSLVKYNSNKSSESDSSIVVSMGEIQRLLKNDQVIIISPKGRRVKCKERYIRSQTNIKQSQLLPDNSKTTTKCKETIVHNFTITTNKDKPQKITKETNKKKINDLKTDTKSLIGNTEKRQLNFSNRIAKYISSFAKKKKPNKKEKVDACTDAPSLYSKCHTLDEDIIYNANNPNSISGKKCNYKISNLKRVQNINIVRNNKSNEDYSDTQSVASRATDDQFAKYINMKNYFNKRNSVKHNLKEYLSTLHIRNKYLDNFLKYTQLIKTNQCSEETNNGTRAPYNNSLLKQYDLEKSEINVFDFPREEESCRDTKSSVLYHISHCEPPSSRHNIKSMKRRKHHYDRQNNRFKFTQPPLPDAPSYCFNKYNFSEDELIRKAIKTAIKHQILKTSYSKLTKPKRKKKYMKKSGRQYSSRKSFAQRFYTMNVHHLKPYECKPSVCVPDIDRCDPHGCRKLINKRLKNGASTSSTTTFKTRKSVFPKIAHKPKYHCKQEYHTPPSREEFIATYAPRKRSVPVGGGGITYTKLGKKRSKKKHMVRIGSSYSLNVEFSKGKSGGSVMPKSQEQRRHTTQIKQEKRMDEKNILKTQQAPKKPVKTQIAAEQTKFNQKNSSTTTSALPNKHEQLKRCFCTFKLQKRGKRTRRNLEPHECEPNVCIPGHCDPKECLKRIKYRDRGFNAEPVPFTCHCTSSSGTSPMKSVKPKKGSPLAKSEKPKRRESRVLDQKKSRVHEERVILPRGQLNSNKIRNKQAVKIGSTFSFSLEFYKDVAPPVIEIVPDLNQPIKPLFVNRERKSSSLTRVPKKIRATKVGRKSSVVTDYGVDRGSEPRPMPLHRQGTEVYGLKDRGVETRMAPEKIVKSRGTATLRRCFCTLKLHKEGLVPAGQLVKHQGTETEKYECEPGVCIPGESNPSECYKRIQEKYCKDHPSKTIYPGRIPRSQSTATYYKHASMGTKRPKCPRLSRGQGLEPVYRDVCQSIKTIIEEPRYRPILRKTRQVVRLGSDFKFNIELFKDKVEHKAERIPEPTDKPEAKRQKLIIKGARTYKQEIEEPKTVKRSSYFRRSRPYKESTKKPIVICKCPDKTAEIICKCQEKTSKQKFKVAQPKAKKVDKWTKKEQLKLKRNAAASICQPENNASVMTILKRCFCTLKPNNEENQTIYTALLSRYKGPYQCREKFNTAYAISDHYYENSNSPTVTHKYCKETELLLKDVLGQPKLSFIPQKYCVSNINANESVNSQSYLKDYQSSRDKWPSSVTGFLPVGQNRITAMIVDNNNTCGPKTCKANPYKLTIGTKTGKIQQLHITVDKNSEKNHNERRKSDCKYIKNKNHANNSFCAQRTEPSLRYPKKSSYQSNILKNSRLKLIKDPFRQAVRMSSSFSLSLKLSRGKLPVDSKPTYKLKRHKINKPKYSGVNVQTRRKKREATEQDIYIGTEKLGKVSMNMNGIKVMNKNISCDFPFKPLKFDACQYRKKNKYKTNPIGCNLDHCTCSTKKVSKKLSRRSLLPKRESVKIGSKLSCNVEFFKDQNYLGGSCHTGEVNTHSMKAGHPKQSVSTVRSAFKKCLSALKFHKQIVNYLSIDSESPFKLEQLNVAERYGSHSKYKLHTENGSKHNLASHQMLNNDTYDEKNMNLKTAVKSQSRSNSEIKTIYPYIPKKFNKSSKSLLYKKPKISELRKCDSKYQNRKYRRIDNSNKDRETNNRSQNILLELFKNLFEERFILALKHRTFKRPLHDPDKPNVIELRKKTMPSQIISRISCNNNQHQNTIETLKVSKTERLPMKTRLIKHPRKSKISRSTIIKTPGKRKKGHADQSQNMAVKLIRCLLCCALCPG